MGKWATFHLQFDGLVEFAQQVPQVELADRFRGPPSDTLNRVERSVPEWVRDDNAEAITLSSEHVLVVEGDTEDRGTLPSALDASKLGDVNPDVLAYYLPYHYYRRETWGVYMRAEGIAQLAQGLKGEPLESRDAALLDAARWILYEHEYYHCVVETAATKAELIASSSVYGPYLSDVAGGQHEESLANAHALGVAHRRFSNLATALRAWMSRQPAGYRDFHKWVGRPKFDRGRSQAAQHLIRQLPVGILIRPLSGGEFLIEAVPRSRIPVYIIAEKGSGVGIARPFPKFEGIRVSVHAREHPPPHFHLESPLGLDRGRFHWPSLTALGDARGLSRDERERLDRYLRRYGDEIGRKVAAVFEGTPE
jgi:hypothetical protein